MFLDQRRSMMNGKTYFFQILPKMLNFGLARRRFVKSASPITLTYSVTSACQSRCKTCNIWMKYHENLKRKQGDLKLGEIERVFESIGIIWFFNISGGEPYLRDDLPDIIALACKHLKPRIIHIPTNAIAFERIRDLTVQCLETAFGFDPTIQFTVKPSIDGIGHIHDEIRGVKGNFRLLERTIFYLKELEKKYRNFQLELGTVISKFNIQHLDKIEDYVHALGIQSYRNEIAEQRAEFFNVGDPITPDPETYERLVSGFSKKIRDNIANKRTLAKVTESFRLVYYDLAVKILREKRQVIPCLAGISNVHINYDGEVWPCCVLGYSKPMGSLREQNYDFQKIWRSEQAGSIRNYIKEGNCACPLANQAYSNILCSPTYLFKTLNNVLKFVPKRQRGM